MAEGCRRSGGAGRQRAGSGPAAGWAARLTALAPSCRSGTLLDHKAVAISGPKAGEPVPDLSQLSTLAGMLFSGREGGGAGEAVKNRCVGGRLGCRCCCCCLHSTCTEPAGLKEAAGLAVQPPGSKPAAASRRASCPPMGTNGASLPPSSPPPLACSELPANDFLSALSAKLGKPVAKGNVRRWAGACAGGAAAV